MSIKPDCLWDEIALAGKELCERKQHDYGPHSISNTGNIGVAVRLNDKVTRLLNLIQKMDKGDEPPHWESIRDTYTDIMNYAVIGLLLFDGKWADKVSMREIFGEDPDVEPLPMKVKLGSFPATLGECKVRPVLVFDDDGDIIEPHKPWHPLFDWSPYIGKNVAIYFNDGSGECHGVLDSVGKLRKYVTFDGYRYSTSSIDSIRLWVYGDWDTRNS